MICRVDFCILRCGDGEDELLDVEMTCGDPAAETEGSERSLEKEWHLLEVEWCDDVDKECLDVERLCATKTCESNEGDLCFGVGCVCFDVPSSETCALTLEEEYPTKYHVSTSNVEKVLEKTFSMLTLLTPSI